MACADRGLDAGGLAALQRLCADAGMYTLLTLVDELGRLLPAAEKIGAAASPRDERVHFTHASGLHFDHGEVVAVELHGEPPVARVTASLLGLCGGAAPLPLYMAEEADQDDEQGAAIRGLLDLFHHRSFSLLVRGLRDIDLATAIRPDGSDAWSRRVLALLGHDDTTANSLPRPTLLRLAPILASGVRSPAMLAAALRICLESQLGQATLRVEPLSGSWTAIDEPQWTRLGAPTARLDDSAVLGTEVLHPSGAASIVIGPLSGEHYKIFTPGHAGHDLTRALTDGFTPEPIHYDLVLEIEDLRYPPGLLGLRHLGVDMWLARSDLEGVKTRMVVGCDRHT